MVHSVDTPSGKNAADENFPVGSWLLPAERRPHIACFYAFARAADDIADNPGLDPDEKIRLLDGFEAALDGPMPGQDGPAFSKAIDMTKSLRDTGVSDRHCRDLLAAFRQDALQSRFASWPELMAYCRLSAAPVGRYLIDLHGGCDFGYWASDALCAALQLINHVQDCGDDYQHMNRVYLPTDWLAEAGAKVDDLGSGASTTGLRQVLDWTLIGIDSLLREAEALPGQLQSRRLAMEASVIHHIAKALSRQLARRDPLTGRVTLSKPAVAVCSVKGVVTGMLPR